MSLLLSVMVAGFAWLFLGSRLAVARDAEQNNLLNFFVYILIAMPFCIAVVFFVLQ